MKDVDEKYLVPAIHQATMVGGTMLDQVPDVPEGEPFAQEWRTFKREVPRLISEGEAGRFALLKADQVVGIWDTLRDALQASRLQFGGEPLLVQEIQLFFKPMRWGYRRLCRD